MTTYNDTERGAGAQGSSPGSSPDRTNPTTAGDSEEKLRSQRYFPICVSQEHGLSVAMLWAAVERYMQNGETRAVPCDATIAKDLGISERTVRRRRKKAKQAGGALTYEASDTGRRSYELLYGPDHYVGGNGSYRKHGEYVTIPDALWESDLSDAAKALLAYCDRLTTRCCWKTIAQKLGISEPTLREAREEARKSRKLRYQNKPGQPPKFQVANLTRADSFFILPDDIFRGADDIFIPTHQYLISVNISTKSVQMSGADRQRRRPALTNLGSLIISETSSGEKKTDAPGDARENGKRRAPMETEKPLDPLRKMVDDLRRQHGLTDLVGFEFERFKNRPIPTDVCNAVRRRLLGAYTIHNGGLRRANGDAVGNACGLLCKLLKSAYTECVECGLSAEEWRVIEEDNMRSRSTGEVQEESEDENGDCEQVTLPTGTEATAQMNMDWQSETEDVTAEEPPFAGLDPDSDNARERLLTRICEAEQADCPDPGEVGDIIHDNEVGELECADLRRLEKLAHRAGCEKVFNARIGSYAAGV